ncbi:hypothetical protein [Bradyrhizobium sp. NP1]|uniref:hypothetical protein n=1 Tax=Bradyrhizobium sp. NP1 TaxID=3049772 RepID=UPI0025A4FE48|nr:hypothetical protein [Bradyrhizobium sp. NP1]WJR78191.1 hypothetical protein QOU61_36820 [Bradyrhizobium sp. NP1]
MPIGVTVSGEIVFPFQCKDFIERQKAANTTPPVVEAKPAAVEARPAGEQKAAPVDEKSAAAADKQPPADETGAIAENRPAPAEEKGPATDKPAPPEEKSAAVSDKPAAVEEVVARQPEANSKPAVEPAQPAPSPLPRRAGLEPRVRSGGPPGCTHFRTYDAASHTYRTYGGQRRECR